MRAALRRGLQLAAVLAILALAAWQIWRGLGDFTREGRSAHRRHPLLLLGSPSIAAQLRARSPGGAGPCALFLTVTAPRTVAAQAVRQAAGRPVFLVTLGATPVSQRRAVAAFLAALPAPYRHTQTRTLLALGGPEPLSVYEFDTG